MDQVRKRLVNFRVTDEELRRVKAASTLHNARCVSDYARSAVLRAASDGEKTHGANGSTDSALGLFDRRLATLESNVAQLVEALTSGKLVSHKAES
jgi:hypothetical protein